MQIIKVMGGLGNQMFAYAFALALRARGRDVRLDATWYERCAAHNGWELPRVFRIGIPLCSIEDRDRLGDMSASIGAKLRRKLLGERRGHYRERRPGYDERFLRIEGDAYLDGFWQSPRYHEGIGREIEEAFAFAGALEPRAAELLERAGGRPTVGVHVRRGDYLTSEDLYGVCTEAYYGRAIEAILEGTRDPLLVFFSDDLDWCRDKLASGRDAAYVDWNRGLDSWRDMRLMTACDRLVIANSSFSWWGARLGRAGRSIAAPARWFGGKGADNPDIRLPEWRRIDS